MKDTRRAKALALKRLEDAETAVMLREGEDEAKVALRQEYDAFMAYLGEIDGIDERKKRFLAALAQSGLPSRACFTAAIPPRTYYQWLSDDEAFRELVTETKKFANDRLEQVAIDLATGAYMRPLVSQGRIAAYERIYDTKALLAMLKARKPQEFAQKIDVTSNGHTIVKLIDKEAWDAV